MELTLILFSGAVAGLVAGTLNAIIAPWIVPTPASAPRSRMAADLASVGIHAVAGIVLALVFWLSWGLTAIVGVPWWQRGLSFALLLWSAPALLLGAHGWSARMPLRTVIKLGSDWLLTCVLVGMACAWSWHRGG